MNDPFRIDYEVKEFIEDESVEDLLYEFLKERTPMTEQAYKRDLRDFFRFTSEKFEIPKLDGKRMRFEDIRRVHVVKYKKHLETNNSLRRRPFSPNTIGRKLSAISSFFEFLMRRWTAGT